ncbi:MAG: DUF3999 domain-containing protein [Methylotenera sp.]|nr:DUF3999 domain-containing protein [Methylotenera sp.]
MKLTLILLAATFCLANTARAESFRLEASGSEPLYQTSLPKAVYQHSRSYALQDLSITNAVGEQVPYALLGYGALHPKTATTQDREPLPVFPIKESSLSNPGTLSVQIEKSTSNTSVNITSNDKNTKEKTVYIVDAGKKHPPLKTLNIDWQGREGVLLTLDVLASDDLKNWSNVGQGVLLKTSADGKALLQNNISLDNATEARYLQIRAADNATLNLTKINAEYNSVRSLTLQMHWQNVRSLQREQDDKKGVINLDFESIGRYPAEYLRVYLPQTNTITSASILVRNRNDEPWQYLTTASLYRMDKTGKSYTNPDVLLNASAARYWRLQFNQSSGGIGAENPKLSLGWLPQTVVWNARGPAPFNLQIGADQKIINAVGITSLIPEYKIEKVMQLPIANLTVEVSANNDSTAQAGNAWETPIDYKRWLLWSGLLLGVLLLAGMAYSLIKTDNKQ